MEYSDIAKDLSHTKARLAGLKQVLRALEGGNVRIVVLARDVDAPIAKLVEDRCAQAGVPCLTGPAMQQLGQACKLDVATAVACLLQGK